MGRMYNLTLVESNLSRITVLDPDESSLTVLSLARTSPIEQEHNRA